MLAAAIDERGDGAAAEDVETSSLQGESITRKITDGRREVELAVKPRLDSVLIGRGDVGEMVGLQRTQMGIDHFRGLIFAFLVAAGKEAPTHGCDEQESSGSSEPAHWQEPKSKFGARGGGKIRTNFAAKRDGRCRVKLRALEGRAQSLLRFESGKAIGAGFQVALKFRSPGGVQFAVEIAVKNGLRVLTAHGRPPAERAA